LGVKRLLHEGTDIALLSIGAIGNLAAEAIAQLDKEGGPSVAHYDMRFLKPIDEEILHTVGQNFSRVITLENGVTNGGFGSAVLEFFADNGYTPHVERLGLPDEFVTYGSVPQLLSLCHLDVASIVKKVYESTSQRVKKTIQNNPL
jgi:1-deoxy-D-xylulose-5-phosphate synthase